DSRLRRSAPAPRSTSPAPTRVRTMASEPVLGSSLGAEGAGRSITAPRTLVVPCLAVEVVSRLVEVPSTLELVPSVLEVVPSVVEVVPSVVEVLLLVDELVLDDEVELLLELLDDELLLDDEDELLDDELLLD